LFYNELLTNECKVITTLYKMKKMRNIFMKTILICVGLSAILIFLLTACNFPQGGTPTTDPGTVATKVAATLGAMTQSAQQTPVNTLPYIPTIPRLNTQTISISPSATFVLVNTPTVTQNPTVTAGPTVSPTPGLGSIAGAIYGYPFGSVPSLAIVAFGQEPPYRYWYLITQGGTSFSMDGYITAGNYQVVGYDTSGHAGGCASIVKVVTNQTVNCDIGNWGGGYPAKPSGVPNP
jgi:hypothetical protein